MTYVPGNHDLLINSDDIQSIMPGVSQARDVRGLGAYTPVDFPELIIEHGHRYNFYCAPDQSNRSITKQIPYYHQDTSLQEWQPVQLFKAARKEIAHFQRLIKMN